MCAYGVNGFIDSEIKAIIDYMSAKFILYFLDLYQWTVKTG